MRNDLSARYRMDGKERVVRTRDRYLLDASPDRTLVSGIRGIENKPKSRSANGIDVERKCQEASKLDEGSVISLRCNSSGYRRKETSSIRPWLNDLRSPANNAFMMDERSDMKRGTWWLIETGFPFRGRL
ncbi:hypothetical protein [Paraburkholderia hospita]|jgi:hypothetical protein|uniref:hypothetical protein n=1 Tax=Paraburkholderia hospita TaxID=169430 RepID=UPI000B3418E2|nr:hypothetical protein [Paraburkholderia hospita]OUL89772.1 hypothetical protein CA603_18230 [Paraburkholderia hospita]